MQIVVNETKFELNCGEWLTVKEWMLIEPILIEHKFQFTIKAVLGVVKLLVNNMTAEEAEEIIMAMDIPEMNELINQVSEILDSKKKTRD